MENLRKAGKEPAPARPYAAMCRRAVSARYDCPVFSGLLRQARQRQKGVFYHVAGGRGKRKLSARPGECGRGKAGKAGGGIMQGG